MSQNIAKINQSETEPDRMLSLTLNETLTLGEVLAKSGFFADTKQAAQAVVKILAGRELGIAPVAAMKGIHVIEGKIELSATLMAALIKRSGKYSYRIMKLDAKECEIVFFEGAQQAGPAVNFSLEDAKTAGLAGKKNWTQYAEDMLFARALSRGARRYCPDIFSGPIYVEGEIEVEAAQLEPEPVRKISSLEQFKASPQTALAMIEQRKRLNALGVEDENIKSNLPEPFTSTKDLPEEQARQFAGMLREWADGLEAERSGN